MGGSQMKKHYSPGWIYFAVFAAVVAIFTPAVYETLRQTTDDSRELAQYPDMTEAEILKEYEAVESLVKAEPGVPVDYYDALHRINTLEGAARKNRKSERPIHDRSAMVAILSQQLANDLQAAYTKKHGNAAMSYAGIAYLNQHPERDRLRQSQGETYGLAGLWGIAYLFVVPILGIFFIVRLGEAGFNLALEFANFLKPAWAALLWPIAIWRYPNDKMVQHQVVAAMRFATLTLSSMLSFGGAGVMVKAQDSGKAPTKEQGYSLQIDTHHGEAVGDDPPDPQEILRLNFGMPSGAYAEVLHIEGRTSQTNIVTAGSKVRDLPGGVLNVYGGLKTVTEEPEGSKSVLAGAQVFTGRGRFSFVMPIAQVERSLDDKPVNRFTTLLIASMKLGKKAYAGIESFMQAGSDGSRFWYSGPVVGFAPTPSLLMVGGCYQDSDGMVRWRAEMMHTVRW